MMSLTESGSEARTQPQQPEKNGIRAILKFPAGPDLQFRALALSCLTEIANAPKDSVYAARSAATAVPASAATARAAYEGRICIRICYEEGYR
eukprot:3680847-Rhodomonas_salina.2